MLTEDEIWKIADHAETATIDADRNATQRIIENAIRTALSMQLARLVTFVPAQAVGTINLAKS